MKKTLLVISIIITIILFFIINITQIYSKVKSYIYPDKRQVASERNIKEDSLVTSKKFDLIKLYPQLYNPIFCEFDKYNNIFTLEYNSMIIYKINPMNSNYIKFGNGKGKGPGEFINPTDFKINDTLIYLTDPKNNKVSIYSTFGNFVKDIKTDEKLPERIVVPSPDQLIITKQNEMEENRYFSVYNFKGELIKQFGRVIVEKEFNTPSQKTMYYDGFLTETSDTSFVYATCRTGYMALYKNNRLTLRTTTIDGAQDPGFEFKQFMKVFTLTRIDEDAMYTASEIKSNGEYILIRVIKDNKRFYDLYDKDDLKYKITLKLPSDMTYYDINEKYIAGLCDNYTKLVLFKLPHIATD